jgi:hypothetical protein
LPAQTLSFQKQNSECHRIPQSKVALTS